MLIHVDIYNLTLELIIIKIDSDTCSALFCRILTVIKCIIRILSIRTKSIRSSYHISKDLIDIGNCCAILLRSCYDIRLILEERTVKYKLSVLTCFVCALVTHGIRIGISFKNILVSFNIDSRRCSNTESYVTLYRITIAIHTLAILIKIAEQELSCTIHKIDIVVVTAVWINKIHNCKSCLHVIVLLKLSRCDTEIGSTTENSRIVCSINSF